MDNHRLLKNTMKGFHVHELLQIYHEFFILQPISHKISESCSVFGIQDMRDYGIDADPICTSVYEMFLQLMIDDIAKHIPTRFAPCDLRRR